MSEVAYQDEVVAVLKKSMQGVDVSIVWMVTGDNHVWCQH